MDWDHPDSTGKSLRMSLENLLGDAPSDAQLKAAQQLFADVIDCPGGLQIMTIHSFCQSVLGRFPLEADLPPNFTLLNETNATELIKQAQKKVLHEAQSEQQTAITTKQCLKCTCT